ncbi:MAG: triose-phosphate isomerase [Thermoplasmata archaeon]
MLLFINFKSYPEATGKEAMLLIKEIEEKIGYSENIAVVTNPLDSLIDTRIKKYIQNAEAVEPGPMTGHIPIPLLKKYGYSGVMLNHSEFKLPLESIGKAVSMSKNYGMRTLVCAADIPELEKISEFRPDMVAYEPPELIGGNISVSTAKPEIIRQASSILEGKGIKLIVGAGIKEGKDVKMSRELGADGVLVASGVVKSKEPIKVIERLLREV